MSGTVEIHAVANEIIVLKLPAGSSDPMAREEVARVTIDLSAGIEAAP